MSETLEKAFDPQERPRLAKLARARARIVGIKNTSNNWLANFNLSVVEHRKDKQGKTIVTHRNPDWQPREDNRAGILKLITRHVEQKNPEKDEKLVLPNLVTLDPFDQMPSDEKQRAKLEKLLHDVNSPKRIRVEDERIEAEKRQHLNVTQANWDTFSPDSAVTVYEPLYLNTIKDGQESQARILELARQMSDRPLLAFDHPNMGGSDPMTREQKTTGKKDSYFAIADAQLQIMKQMGVKKINLVGLSMGAYASLAIALRAKEFGINVENLVLVETPGVKHMFSPLMLFQEWKEGRRLDVNHASPADPLMWEASRFTSPDQKVQMPPPTEAWQKDPWLRYGRAMTKNTVRDRLNQALATQDDMQVLFVNGTESKISPMNAVKKIVKGVADEDQWRVNRAVFSGEGHLTNVHPKRLAGLVKSQLDNRIKHPSEGKPAAEILKNVVQ